MDVLRELIQGRHSALLPIYQSGQSPFKSPGKINFPIDNERAVCKTFDRTLPSTNNLFFMQEGFIISGVKSVDQAVTRGRSRGACKPHGYKPFRLMYLASIEAIGNYLSKSQVPTINAQISHAMLLTQPTYRTFTSSIIMLHYFLCCRQSQFP